MRLNIQKAINGVVYEVKVMKLLLKSRQLPNSIQE